MTHEQRPSRLIHLFLIERYWPGVTASRAAIAAGRLDAEAAATTGPVRHLRTGLVPDDELVWSMVEAESRDAVIAVTARASYPVDRISETIVVGGRRR
jgi:hypothetical protein